jgi:hypothetical protein
MEKIRLIRNPARRRPLDEKVLPGLRDVNHNANFMIILDSHSVTDTGAVVCGGSADNLISANIDKVC